MIRVHFLINKLDIEHIIALGGKKSNEKLGKKGNRCKNAANSVTGHVCVNSNDTSPYVGISIKKNVPWHILAPSAVACDIFLLRASAHPRGAFFVS